MKVASCFSWNYSCLLAPAALSVPLLFRFWLILGSIVGFIFAKFWHFLCYFLGLSFWRHSLEAFWLDFGATGCKKGSPGGRPMCNPYTYNCVSWRFHFFHKNCTGRLLGSSQKRPRHHFGVIFGTWGVIFGALGMIFGVLGLIFWFLNEKRDFHETIVKHT